MFVAHSYNSFNKAKIGTRQKTIWCLNIYGTYVTANNSANNNVVFFFVSDLKIKQVKLATLVKGDLKAPFSIATTPRCREERYSFPGFFHFTLDAYLIILSVKQGGIKYHFLSLWYDST